MKKLFILLAFVFFYFNSSAQPPMAVYAELGGPGFMSFNFDTRFSQNEDGLGARAGFGGFFVSSDGNKGSLMTIPLGLNYLLGKDGKNYFELGAGYTHVILQGSTDEGDRGKLEASFGNITLGYRLAPANGGFMFKAQITPLFNSEMFMPYYGGIGFGYKF